jgi:hypothetical protein
VAAWTMSPAGRAASDGVSSRSARLGQEVRARVRRAAPWLEAICSHATFMKWFRTSGQAWATSVDTMESFNGTCTTWLESIDRPVASTRDNPPQKPPH